MKLKKMQDNYNELTKVQNDRMREIVDILDLFNGELSLNDILNQDIPIINALKEQKIQKVKDSNNIRK